MKNYIRLITVLFIIILLILSFFSKSIYNKLLPEVSVTTVNSGFIKKTVNCIGTIRPGKVLTIYQPIGAKIMELDFEVGDKVLKGKQLYKLDYSAINNEIDNCLSNLEVLELNRQKILLSLEENNEKINKILENIILYEGELEELRDKNGILQTDYTKTPYLNPVMNDRIIQAFLQYEKSFKEYSNNQILYDAGALSKMELEDSESVISTNKYEYYSLITNEIESNNTEINNKLTQIETFQESITQNQKNIDALNIDLSLNNLSKKQEEKIHDDLVEKLNKCKYISSPIDGIIKEIYISLNEYVSENMKAIDISIMGNDYSSLFAISKDVDFLSIGDSVDLTIYTDEEKYLEGVVYSIENDISNIDQSIYTINFNIENITGNELIEMDKTIVSKSYEKIVPKNVINKDRDGYFVYAVEKKKTLLGYGNFVKKIYVFLGDSDDENIVITRGLDIIYPLISNSTRIISDGQQVRISGE